MLRRLIGALMVVAGCLAVVACQPPSTKRTMPLAGTEGSWSWASINRDGTDSYMFEDQGFGLLARALTSNTHSNLRYALIRSNEPTSVDQQACATWNGPKAMSAQPGVVLRAQLTPQRTKLIMVTSNILFGARNAFNVHVADTDDSKGPLTQVGGRSMEGALGGYYDQRKLPWRFCARAIGDQITVKTWALNDVPEPAWDDPVYAFSVTVPAAYASSAGQAGLFIGHLAPGEEARIPDLATEHYPPASRTGWRRDQVKIDG